jgi:outer membrane protein
MLFFIIIEKSALQLPTFATLILDFTTGMKNFNNIALAVLAIAVAVLFFLQFGGKSGKKGAASAAGTDSSGVSVAGRIAYFEMDSIEQQYLYITEVQSKLKQREQVMTAELQGMRNGYMGRIQQLQSKASTMNQQEGESAQAEINQMERTLQQKEAKMGQELQEEQFKLMQDINKKIEEYLAQYNSNKGYTYIISRQAGDFIYYKDSTFNITVDLVKGLNDQYNVDKGAKKEEKKK